MQNGQENNCARVSFPINLQTRGLQLYWKRNPTTGAFLWILQFFSEQPFCKTSACVCKPKLMQKLYVYNRKEHFKKNFYVLTHMHLLKTSRSLFSYLSSNKSKVILKTNITHNKSKFVWNSRNNSKSLATIFLSQIFFYKIIPTYIFNSLNCCLKSVIYDVYGASTGLSVMG